MSGTKVEKGLWCELPDGRFGKVKFILFAIWWGRRSKKPIDYPCWCVYQENKKPLYFHVKDKKIINAKFFTEEHLCP